MSSNQTNSHLLTPWLAAVLIFTALLYIPSLRNQFVTFDDNALIFQNGIVTHPSPAMVALAFSSYDPELYIPLTFLVYQGIHVFFGEGAGAYHAMSLLLHLLNTWLIGWIIWQLTRRRSVAVIVAALFAVHPLQSETVLWASAMKDVLSTSFGLLSLSLYLHYKESSERRFFFLCILCFGLGLLAKVSIVLLPLAFLLIEWAQGRPITRQSIMEKWPLLGLAVIFLGVALAGKTSVIGGAGFLATLLLSFKASAFYFLKLLWPSHLSVIYPQTLSPSLLQADIIASILLALFFLGVAFWYHKKHRVMSACIVWYGLLLLPSFANFYKNGHLYFASDRYAYLPSIGLFLLCALGVSLLWEKKKWSHLPLSIVGGFLLIIYSYLTFQQIGIWYDSKSLFGNVIRLYPDSVIAQNNYAAQLNNAPEVLPYYEKAIALDPGFITAYRNIAGYYHVKGDDGAARAAYERGVAAIAKKENVTDDDLSLMFEYAQFLDDAGESNASMTLLEKALSYRPDFSEAHYNLGVKYQKYGRTDAAFQEFFRAVELNNTMPDYLYHLAGMEAERGMLQEAATHLRRLLSINPSYEGAKRHLEGIEQLLR